MRRRRLQPAAAPAESPIIDLNTTPLIDVLLVLLIMFIITIPITTHKVPLDLPGGPPPPARPEPLVHRLDMDAAGSLSWNAAPIAEAQLPARLAAVTDASELHLRIDGEAPYENFDRVLATVQRAGIERLGLIDNHRFADFR